MRIGDAWVYNPTGAQLLAEGWLPVIESEAPETDERHYAELHWAEQGNSIVQEWEIVEIPATDELTPDEALGIILGGAE